MQIDLYTDMQGAERLALLRHVEHVLQVEFGSRQDAVSTVGVHLARTYNPKRPALRCMLEARLPGARTVAVAGYGETMPEALNAAVGQFLRDAPHPPKRLHPNEGSPSTE
jgi:hypothetical protein